MAQVIVVFEPRYRDKKVLLAKYRLPKNEDVIVNITKGAYKGNYKVSAKDIAEADDDVMQSKQGNHIALKAVSLDKLERIGD